MKKFVAIALIASFAGMAFAVERSVNDILVAGEEVQINAMPLGSVVRDLPNPTTVYSNMDPGPTGYVAGAPASGYIGYEDYTPIAAMTMTEELQEFKFVGGVANAGEVAFFDFYDAADNLVDSFGIQFSQGGNFIYTITIGSVVNVPAGGEVWMWVDDGSVLTPSTGQWFAGDAGPTIGGPDDPLEGTFAGYVQNFEITVPEPASLLLFGLAGLFIRRR